MTENTKNDTNPKQNKQTVERKSDLFNGILNSWINLRKKYLKDIYKADLSSSNNNKIEKQPNNIDKKDIDLQQELNTADVENHHEILSQPTTIVNKENNITQKDDLLPIDSQNHIENIKNENAVLKAQLSRAEEKINQLQNEIKQLNEKILSLSSENNDLKDQVNHKIKPLLETIEKLKLQLADEVLAKNHLQLELKKLRSQLEESNNEKQKLEVELNEKIQNIEKFVSEIEKLKSEKALLQERFSNQKKAYEETLKQKEILESEITEKENELILYKIKVEDHIKLQNELEKLRKQEIAWLAREKKLINDLETVTQENKLLKNKLQKLTIGVKEYINYPKEYKVLSDPEIPAQASLLLPLCFPENIYKQLKIMWRKSINYKVLITKCYNTTNNNPESTKSSEYQFQQKLYIKTFFLRPSLNIYHKQNKLSYLTNLNKMGILYENKYPIYSINYKDLKNFRYSLSLTSTKLERTQEKRLLDIENVISFRIYTPKLSSYLYSGIKHLRIFENSISFYCNYLSATISQINSYLFRNIEYKIKLLKLKPFEREVIISRHASLDIKTKQTYTFIQELPIINSQIIMQKIKKFDIYSDIRKINVLFSSLESSVSNILEKYIHFLQKEKEQNVDK